MTQTTTRDVGAFHTAHLDLVNGVGLLTRPHSREDVWLGPESLHGSDWNAAVRELDSLGWEPLADDDGLPMIEGLTGDGREVVALYGRSPIVTMPDFDDIIAATNELRAQVLDANT